MSTNNENIFEDGIYFITFTNYQWLHLFHLTNGYSFVYNWFDSMKEKGHNIVGYVIMPNHVHALIAFNFAKDKRNINNIIGSGKRFIAYGIVENLATFGPNDLLSVLAKGITSSEAKRGKQHQVYEPTTDIKHCRGAHFINQKLEYMHNNPISKKWMLVPERSLYPHSSAKYYDTGGQGVYEVISYNELMHYWD